MINEAESNLQLEKFCPSDFDKIYVIYLLYHKDHFKRKKSNFARAVFCRDHLKDFGPFNIGPYGNLPQSIDFAHIFHSSAQAILIKNM